MTTTTRDPYVHDIAQEEIDHLRSLISEHVIRALDGYVAGHQPTGGFVRACLENNLRLAIQLGDPQNRATLPVIVSYLVNCIPGCCWGSPEAVEAWLEKGVPHG